MFGWLPKEDPEIDRVALRRRNLCSFLAHLTKDGICDFSQVLILALQNGLEIERTPEEVNLFKTDLLLARQTMSIAGKIIWKHSKNETLLPQDWADGELWIPFGNGKSRYCKERWKFWRRRFVHLSDGNGLGKYLPEQTRKSLKSVADFMTDTRDDWTGLKPEYLNKRGRLPDPHNPFSARSESPEPVLQQDYGHQAPRRVPTDADRFGSAAIEEYRSKVFGPRDAKGNKTKRAEDDVPLTASKAPASRKRKRAKLPEPQPGVPVPSQDDPPRASQAPAPRSVERPEFHYPPQQPGAPIPSQSNPPTKTPEEAGPPQSKRPKPDPASPQLKLLRRAPKSESIRKIREPLDSPIEEIRESKLRHGYLQYQVKFINIPLDKKEWYDSIGFKNDRDLAKIQEFHWKHPEAANEDTSAAWLAAKDERQNAKALNKVEEKRRAKMTEEKTEEGAGYGFKENVLEEKEHLDKVAFKEDSHCDQRVEDAQSAAG